MVYRFNLYIPIFTIIGFKPLYFIITVELSRRRGETGIAFIFGDSLIEDSQAIENWKRGKL